MMHIRYMMRVHFHQGLQLLRLLQCYYCIYIKATALRTLRL
jgi:hypothetical protein